jgi:hypothetical protein
MASLRRWSPRVGAVHRGPTATPARGPGADRDGRPVCRPDGRVGFPPVLDPRPHARAQGPGIARPSEGWPRDGGTGRSARPCRVGGSPAGRVPEPGWLRGSRNEVPFDGWRYFGWRLAQLMHVAAREYGRGAVRGAEGAGAGAGQVACGRKCDLPLSARSADAQLDVAAVRRVAEARRWRNTERLNAEPGWARGCSGGGWLY